MRDAHFGTVANHLVTLSQSTVIDTVEDVARALNSLSHTICYVMTFEEKEHEVKNLVIELFTAAYHYERAPKGPLYLSVLTGETTASVPSRVEVTRRTQKQSGIGT